MRKDLNILIAFSVLAIIAACNPFAPGLSEGDNSDRVITDRKTVEGVFKNFSYAYTFKDTLVYGELLAHDFKFTYHNFDRGDNPSWNRNIDMQKTHKLFDAAYKIDLLWNESWSEVSYEEGDTMFANVNRRFTLTVYYSPTVYDYVYGNAFFKLRRFSEDEPWKIILWDDQSA